jgi:hypothetical protein
MNSPKFLSEINPDDYLEVYTLLEGTTIPHITGNTGRAASFGPHRAMTLGMIKARGTKHYGLSSYSKKYPELYDAVVRFGQKICPIPFSAIHINHNVVCPRHIDGNNVGDSVIVSLGDYEGGKLFIEGHGEFDTNCRPLLFNGSKCFHWNTPILGGNKYSLVFFHNPA